jgi:hypothetical protein
MGQIRLMPARLMRRRVAQGECGFGASARGPAVEPIMTRGLRGSLLIASMLVVLWTTSSQACYRRRACRPNPSYYQSGCTTGSPAGYHSSGQGGYVTKDCGDYGGGYPGGTAGYPGGYGYGQPGYGHDYGRPGYNPGGIGGPASGLGVRPGLGVGGFGPGRRPSAGCAITLRGALAETYLLTRAAADR